MDSRSYPPSENERNGQGVPGSGNPRANNFKVSIDAFNHVPDEYVPPKRPGSYNMTQKPSRENFEVNIPKKRPASQRPAASRPSGAKSTAKRKKAAAGRRSAPKKTAAPERVLTPEQRARMNERKKQRRTRGFMIACICAVIIVIITATASALALSTINDILVLKKSDSTKTISVVIPEGSDFNDVYDILCDNGLVHQKFITKLFCKFRHYDKAYSSKQKKNVAIEYTPGVYYLEPDSGIETMLETIKQSNAVSKDTVRLTFPEGWTIAQVFEKIEKYNVCAAEKLYANLDIAGQQFSFYKSIPANSGRYLKAEGYIFPDTYDFYIGENANSVLKKLFSNFTKKWTKEFTAKAKELGMTQDQIIILASIIQREAKDKSQMADISSVLHNRLDDPATYPQLQMNSTKEYITAVNKYNVFSEFYYSIYLDAYNTYSAEGLPPGAICNPGIDAIEAALNPHDTNYHFFCHDSKGNIYLAETAAEHQKNTEKIFYESD